jgi:hypothetical protein
MQLITQVKLVSHPRNNPCNLHDGHFTAHIGLYPKFSTFIASYTDSIERLYKLVSEGNETADSVGIPLLFLMRHTLELGYKFSLVYLCEHNSTVFNPEDRKNGERHSLMLLHKRLGMEYSQALKKGIVPGTDHGFDDLYAFTEKGMRLFEELDERSTKLRFPKIDESPAFGREKKVNLLDAKNAFDDAMTLLTTMADVIAGDEYHYG